MTVLGVGKEGSEPLKTRRDAAHSTAPADADVAIFNAAAVKEELTQAALAARIDRGAPALTAIIEDVSRLANLTRTPARGRNETALRERHAARHEFLIKRLHDCTQQAVAGDPVACYRLRNTIEILAASTRRAVVVLGESPANAVAPGAAVRSRAA